MVSKIHYRKGHFYICQNNKHFQQSKERLHCLAKLSKKASIQHDPFEGLVGVALWELIPRSTIQKELTLTGTKSRKQSPDARKTNGSETSDGWRIGWTNLDLQIIQVVLPQKHDLKPLASTLSVVWAMISKDSNMYFLEKDTQNRSDLSKRDAMHPHFFDNSHGFNCVVSMIFIIWTLLNQHMYSSSVVKCNNVLTHRELFCATEISKREYKWLKRQKIPLVFWHAGIINLKPTTQTAITWDISEEEWKEHVKEQLEGARWPVRPN